MEHLINYEKLSHLDENDYKTLVDKTRLQECFFKIITNANLSRKSQLYKDLMMFCKDEKFENIKYSEDLDNLVDIRKEINAAYQQDPKSQEVEEKYNANKTQIKVYEEAFKNVQYLDDIVKSFVDTINKSNHHASEGAKKKLRNSSDKISKDPYISKNIQALFEGKNIGSNLTNSRNSKECTL